MRSRGKRNGGEPLAGGGLDRRNGEESVMRIFAAGLSYKTAPVELRERMAVAPAKLACAGCRLKVGGGLDEVVVLSTCNRVEIYGVAPDRGTQLDAIFQHLAPKEVGYQSSLYLHEGVEAVRHLLSVTSGMDSMVLGETEITGQVKLAYEAARAARLTGPVTNRLFQKAFQTAKAIRTRTQIGRGATSVGSVAVELAERIFGGDLRQHAVMILGAGKMGEACVRHLAKTGVRAVLVANRSFERAQHLAGEFGGRALRLEDCVGALGEADIVVSSTGSPQTVLHRPEIEAAMRARRNRPLVLIDIAVPRDIAADVQQLDNVYLYNIDHLEAIVREHLHVREQELGRCHEIIEEQAREVMARFAPQPVEAGRPATAGHAGLSLFQPAGSCG